MNSIQTSKLFFSVFLGLLLMVSTAQAEVVIDAFSRSDGAVATDSIGDTEVPMSYHWSEGYLVWDYAGDGGRINSGKVELHSSGGPRQITLNTDSADIIAETDFTFVLGEGTGPAADAMMLLRRNHILGGGLFWEETGTVYINFSPTGLLTIKEVVGGTAVELYKQNPWTGSALDTYGAAGSLPALVNGEDFDVDQDGRIGAGDTNVETVTLRASLQGTALAVSIHDQVIFAGAVTGTSSESGNNYFSLAYGATGGDGTVITYLDDVNLDLAGPAAPPFLMGDANGDGVVSAGDYAAVQANFGNTLPPQGAATPEPATICLLFGGGLALLRRRR